MKVKQVLMAVVLLSLFLVTHLMSDIIDPAVIITDDLNEQSDVQVAYNYHADEYLVVWKDKRNASTEDDVYGQFIGADGTPRGNNFAICQQPGYQRVPHVDFDPFKNRYLVVFKDQRNYLDSTSTYYDIYAVLLSGTGEKIWTMGSSADTSFKISYGNESADWPSVSFNHIDKRYLVVWSDLRYGSFPDVFGQLVSDDGNYLARADLAKAMAGIDNFPIAELPLYYEDVTDITYLLSINEWFVVYSFGDVETGVVNVNGQRISNKGTLIRQDGTEGYDPIDCSGETGNGPPCTWPCTQSSYEYSDNLLKTSLSSPTCETLVAWRKGNWMGGTDEDIFAQRISFFTDEEAVAFGWKDPPAVEDRYYAAYFSTEAVADKDSLSNFAVSDTTGDANHFDIAYSKNDNEFIIGWGDTRNSGHWQKHDLYCQILKVNDLNEMDLVDVDHVTLIKSTQNTPVSVDTSVTEGSFMYTGTAHSNKSNEFFLGFVYGTDYSDPSTYDIHGRRISGLAEVQVEETGLTLLSNFRLSQNFPNPFNPVTTIQFTHPYNEHIKITVYDLIGRQIRILANTDYAAGTHQVVWDGKDDKGKECASGIYLYQITSDLFLKTMKMMLIQ